MARKIEIRGNVSEFLRFIFVGVVATATHYAIYLALLNMLSETVAYSIGYGCSLILNFYLTSTFTFKERRSLRKMIGFALSHIVNYAIHISLLWLSLHLGVDEQLAPIPVFAIAVPVNFILVRFVFKSKFFE